MRKIHYSYFLSFIILFTFLTSCEDKSASSPDPGRIIGTTKKENNDLERRLNNLPVEDREGWFQFTENDYFHLDIRYATDNNFVEEKMYECGKCYLRAEAGKALQKVAKSLAQINHKIVLFDCYRPKPVQQKLWDKVPNASYVTPPAKGSMHNRGVAIDLSIMDGDGNYLDMGTEYDFFGKEAHTDNLDLPKNVLRNRKLLNDLMDKYGFKGIRTEWWHFSFVDGSYEIADWEWDCL
ncbi:M15 family metallopeptidase [Portibacter marinus]|uniref:M15 family metallopeptidase n=1 Tax=Portibacter marinus TaxID=2898660 RepID=UPI001F264D6F|nr:M15 family metallopeptidase [Portibacter marinus]